MLPGVSYQLSRKIYSHVRLCVLKNTHCTVSQTEFRLLFSLLPLSRSLQNLNDLDYILLLALFTWELMYFTSMILLIVWGIWGTLTISRDCGNFVRLCFCVVSYYSFFVFTVTLMRETENCQSPRFVILEIASKWFQYCVAFIVSSKERVWAGRCVRVCEL